MENIKESMNALRLSPAITEFVAFSHGIIQTGISESISLWHIFYFDRPKRSAVAANSLHFFK